MNGEQRTWSLVALLICATLIACVFIMARCTFDTASVQTYAAECVKRGGTWHVYGGGADLPAYCEEVRK